MGYWLPHFPFSVVLMEYFFTQGALDILGLNATWAWTALAAQTPLYTLLYIYFDSVIPNAFGISKSLCFCFGSKQNRAQMQNGDEEESARLNNGDAIILDRLTKSFGSFKAVDNLSLSIKENEVFSLLGHNGAGKTTVIYMLTGMLQATSGNAMLYGESINQNVDEVRKRLGLCQQFDVLYEELTVRDHFKLVCRIKGITGA